MRSDLDVNLYLSVGALDFIDRIDVANLERMRAGVAEAFVVWTTSAVDIAGIGVQGGERRRFEVKVGAPFPITSPCFTAISFAFVHSQPET